MKINNCCFSLRGYKKACWIIEKNCNLNCDFCFHNQFTKKEDTYGKLADEYSEIISSLKKCNIKQVILSGGEPLLSCDLFNIIDMLEEHGFNISISTNAVLATPQFCNRLKKTSVEKLTVNLAAICNNDGKIKEDNHSMDIVSGICNLTSNGFCVTLNNILHSSTTKESLLQNIEYACQWGAKTISFTVPICKCFNETSSANYFLSEQIVQQLFLYVKEIEHKISPKIDIEFNYPNCYSDDCPANNEIYGIGTDGILSTCLVKQYQLI